MFQSDTIASTFPSVVNHETRGGERRAEWEERGREQEDITGDEDYKKEEVKMETGREKKGTMMEGEEGDRRVD